MTQKMTEKTCALSMLIAFCIEKVRIVERTLVATGQCVFSMGILLVSRKLTYHVTSSLTQHLTYINILCCFYGAVTNFTRKSRNLSIKITTRMLASTRINVLARVSVVLALALALAFSLLALARYSHFWYSTHH